VVSFLLDFPLIPYIHSSSPPFVLHALPNLSLLADHCVKTNPNELQWGWVLYIWRVCTPPRLFVVRTANPPGVIDLPSLTVQQCKAPRIRALSSLSSFSWQFRLCMCLAFSSIWVATDGWYKSCDLAITISSAPYFSLLWKINRRLETDFFQYCNYNRFLYLKMEQNECGYSTFSWKQILLG
jgi:hypothetical protein